MAICIICRKEKSHFNDEHVIPDSIGGYYHIKTVCTDCNSRMGTSIDSKLTNHKFIEFQRQISNLKGKSGHIPNPFSGTHVLLDNPNQKVTLTLDEKGEFKPNLITKIQLDNEIPSKFSIVIDKRNEKQINSIVEKFSKRNGIPLEQISLTRIESTHNPWIKASMSIDIRGFKLGLLKIAYEFAIDQLPNYFDDDLAKVISQILLTADDKDLDKKITMYGNGLNNELLKSFESYLDFSTDCHYLILYEMEGVGLICFIRLFNTFSIGFLMSENLHFTTQYILFGKNDINEKSFKTYTVEELLKATFGPDQYNYQYWFPNINLQALFLTNEQHAEFAFYKENGLQPLFDKYGVIKYKDINTKLNQPHISKVPSGDTINKMITDYIMDEPVFIKVLPSCQLAQIISVRVTKKRIKKL